MMLGRHPHTAAQDVPLWLSQLPVSGMYLPSTRNPPTGFAHSLFLTPQGGSVGRLPLGNERGAQCPTTLPLFFFISPLFLVPSRQEQPPRCVHGTLMWPPARTRNATWKDSTKESECQIKNVKKNSRGFRSVVVIGVQTPVVTSATFHFISTQDLSDLNSLKKKKKHRLSDFFDVELASCRPLPGSRVTLRTVTSA